MLSLRHLILCLLLLLQFAGVWASHSHGDFLQDNRTVDEVLQEAEEESNEKLLVLFDSANGLCELEAFPICERLGLTFEPKVRHFLLGSILTSAP